MRLLGSDRGAVADEADDGVPHLAQRQVGVVGGHVVRRQVGPGGAGQPQIRAQHVDAGLSQQVGGRVVGEPGQRVHPAQSHRGGLLAELGDAGGEAGVQPGGLPQRAGLVHPPTALGHHQGDQHPGPGHHPETELHQVEEGLGGEAPLRFQPPGTEQIPPGEEHTGDHHDREGEGCGQHQADRPQAQARRS